MKQYIIEIDFKYLNTTVYYTYTRSDGSHMVTTVKEDAFVFDSWEDANEVLEGIKKTIVTDVGIKAIEL